MFLLWEGTILCGVEIIPLHCILSWEVIGVKSIACIKIYVQSGGCLVIYSALMFYVDGVLAQFTSAILFYLEL